MSQPEEYDDLQKREEELAQEDSPVHNSSGEESVQNEECDPQEEEQGSISTNADPYSNQEIQGGSNPYNNPYGNGQVQGGGNPYNNSYNNPYGNRQVQGDRYH